MPTEIKRLEWQEPCAETNRCWVAKSILGSYSVCYEDGWWAVLEDGTRWEWEPEEDCRSYFGPHAAQRACQEHFDATIRSSLIEST